jgi:hypothetical protein
MDPHERVCHNRDCWAFGRAGEGHIVVHSQKERRYRCKRCGRTFSATEGTALYRTHKPRDPLTTAVTLMAPTGARCRPSPRGLLSRRTHHPSLAAVMSGRQCRLLHGRIV